MNQGPVTAKFTEQVEGCRRDVAEARVLVNRIDDTWNKAVAQLKEIADQRTKAHAQLGSFEAQLKGLESLKVAIDAAGVSHV
jgi:uncharacterized protein (DUF3084 family)